MVNDSRRIYVLTTISLAALGAVSGKSASGSTITPYVGVQFYNTNGGSADSLAPSSSAGVYPQSDYNVFVNSGGGGALHDLNGNSTGITLAVTGVNNNYFSGAYGGSGHTANGALLDGEDKIAAGSAQGAQAFYTLSGVPTVSAGETYGLIVYIDNDVSGVTETLGVGSTSYDVKEQQGSTFNGTLIQTSSTSITGNYVEFDGITPTGGTIVLTQTKDAASGGGAVAINGFQLVTESVPEPASMGLIVMGCAAAMTRRRRSRG